MMQSLAGRLLLASLVLLPLFLGGTGFYLERGYRTSLDAAAEQRLQLQVLTLLAEAEYDVALFMPEQLLEARFNQPGSGLYGAVRRADGTTLWTSPSAVAIELPADQPAALAPGQQAFRVGSGLYEYAWSVLWLTDADEELHLSFLVWETTEPAAAQLAAFRGTLLLWLGGAAVALLLGQLLVLRWGLKPLTHLARDLGRIERGEIEQLGGPYPREVQAVTDNLGSLLEVESQRRERSRNTLSDLAHSLKTPLAVIRSGDASAPGYAELVGEQADRMEQIVGYQLQRASGSAHSLLRMEAVAPVADRLRATLLKVYAEKAQAIEVEIPQDCRFRGDERDLLELLGNLMDNACKYGAARVRVTGSGAGDELVLCVEDDGAGIDPALAEAVLERGARADSLRDGQGIGLAVAADIAQSYGGNISIGPSDLGGAAVRVTMAS
ncbi:MAG: two-component sensor histidine kinase [Halioglobus sp.]|nr:two-component sensor histidine kinase [Halioglobus sp.]